MRLRALLGMCDKPWLTHFQKELAEHQAKIQGLVDKLGAAIVNGDLPDALSLKELDLALAASHSVYSRAVGVNDAATN